MALIGWRGEFLPASRSEHANLVVRVPSLRREDLRRVVPVRRQMAAREAGPMIAFPGDGRFTLNTAAAASISPDGPLEAVHFFLSKDGGKRYLVVMAAKRSAEHAVPVSQVGLPKGHPKRKGPTLVQGRGIGFIHQTLGIVDRVRFRGGYDPEKDWLIFPLDEPLPYAMGGPKDPVGEVLAAWVTKQKRPVKLRVAELLDQLSSLARQKKLPFPYGKGSSTPLSAYLRGHAKELERKHKLTFNGFGANGIVTLR